MPSGKALHNKGFAACVIYKTLQPYNPVTLKPFNPSTPMNHTVNPILIAALLLLTSCGNAQVKQAPFTQQPEKTYTKINDFSDVAEQTIDAVVHIKTEMTKLTPLYQSFFGMIIDRGVQRQVYKAYGSGVIISADGYIVTNNHVVQDAERITVTLNDKRVLPARLVGHDPATDLALVKIEASELQYIAFGNSDAVRIGEPVLAIGNPFNLTSTVTSGIVSAKARNVNIIANPGGQESPIESFIQTDAAVNSGNSGGALVNAQGKLIGIVTAIASGDGYYTGYSFAIPSNLASKVVSDLQQYGYVQRAYLGVNVAEMDSRIASSRGKSDIKGVYIGRVIPGCAAANAGLQAGDIILSINNVEINSYAEMMEEIGRFSPGDNVSLTFDRDNHIHSVKVTLLNSQGTTEIKRR